MGDLLDKFLKLEESKNVPDKEISPDSQDEKIVPGEKISASKPKMKPKKILGDKRLNKNQIIHWFKEYIEENQNSFTLDWLRGQKLTFESVNEMRK